MSANVIQCLVCSVQIMSKLIMPIDKASATASAQVTGCSLDNYKRSITSKKRNLAFDCCTDTDVHDFQPKKLGPIGFRSVTQ